MSWCVTLPDVDNVTAETCRRGGNCTDICTVYTYFGSVSKMRCIEMLVSSWPSHCRVI